MLKVDIPDNKTMDLYFLVLDYKRCLPLMW